MRELFQEQPFRAKTLALIEQANEIIAEYEEAANATAIYPG